MLAFHARDILTLLPTERGGITNLFEAFEQVVGPVGAAKSLRPLAARFFPLWDNPIANAYKVGTNAAGHLQFMCIRKHQVERLQATSRDAVELLKRLDEFDYCRCTKKWM